MKLKKIIIRVIQILFVLLLFISCTWTHESSKKNTPGMGIRPVKRWITTGDRSILFDSTSPYESEKADANDHNIEIDTAKRFQKMQGFGFSLTGGSAWVINNKLSEKDRAKLLTELFTTDSNNIGISYLRISIGSSDLDDHVFSYDDLPGGQTDVSLTKFSLDEDRKNLIPLLKEIIKINPEIQIMGSPWSAPSWMKSNGKVKGGSLKKEYYEVYANYLVKYIENMESDGINIHAITIQNEPENPKNTPSMLMSAGEQLEFIKKFLGPAFEREKLDTKIIIFDHNCDHPEYPIEILNDPDSRKYIDGSAFHMYVGDVGAMTTVHNAHPDKSIYFTEQWTSGEGSFKDDLFWHIRNLIIGAPRNWSTNILEWNLSSDPDFKPHTEDGGCDICQGALTIGESVIRNVSYYIIAHASKFVRPGSFRVESSFFEDLPNVAFITPSGNVVLIVLNDSNKKIPFTIRQNTHSVTTSLPPGSVGTYVW
jgi:glucosylceramidase